jgi:cytochrome bd-type quinol oxidase subunit 1
MGLLLSIAYAEFLWHLFKSGQRPYESIVRIIKAVVILNYVLAIVWNSPLNLQFGIICSLYHLVVFRVRANKWT